MVSATKITDHQEIKRWVEAHGGRPARIKRTRGSGYLLRIHFPDYSAGPLEEISWEEFFQEFEKNNLAFLYQPEANNRFNKFVER
jgi:hypothetical protein